MDIDHLADSLDDGLQHLTCNLLSHLPDRQLISDEFPAQALKSADSTLDTVNPNQAGAVVSKIETIFEKVAECILNEKEQIEIKLKTRGKKPTTRNATTGSIQSLQNDAMRTVKFPSKCPKEAWKFTALLRILELSHEALVEGVVTTKRDIFYRDPELFLKQAVVDRYVDDLAYTLGVQRDALNVVATAKGLVAGSLKLERKNGSAVDYTVEPDGLLIPNSRDVRNLNLLGVQWILVIEKEATFRTLATSKYWSTSRAGNGIIITAKGYPDIQTRHFLHLLSIHSPSTPIFALVDFDPDGLGIMSTYKYGSIALAHESANLAVSSIRWLGVRSSDIVQRESGEDKVGMLRLSARDRKIGVRMLEKDMFAEEGREAEWRREMQVMLILNVKVEIQILSSGLGVEEWLDGKLADLVTG